MIRSAAVAVILVFSALPSYADSLGLQITGEEILINHASDTMARGQAASLALMLAVIFLIVSGLFLKVQAGLMALVPTIVPVVFLFGVMGYGGSP